MHTERGRDACRERERGEMHTEIERDESRRGEVHTELGAYNILPQTSKAN